MIASYRPLFREMKFMTSLSIHFNFFKFRDDKVLFLKEKSLFVKLNRPSKLLLFINTNYLHSLQLQRAFNIFIESCLTMNYRVK